MKNDTLTIEPSGERDIVMTRVFNAPRHLVYEALTKPELVQRWLLGPDGWTMPTCEIDLREGGSFRYVWRNKDGREMGMGGTYRELAPPDRIVHTELFDEDWTNGESLVTTVLAEENGKTKMTATVTYSSKETRDAVMQSGMESGVRPSYDRLDEIVSGVAA